jgi:hypothetical protein
MVSDDAFDLAAARKTVQEAKRAIQDTRRRAASADPAVVDFNVAKARQNLDEAELAVKQPVALLNAKRTRSDGPRLGPQDRGSRETSHSRA